MIANRSRADTATCMVSFTVNACNSDAQFLEPTLRHMLPALNYPFSERLVAYDPGRHRSRVDLKIFKLHRHVRGLFAQGFQFLDNGFGRQRGPQTRKMLIRKKEIL